MADLRIVTGDLVLRRFGPADEADLAEYLLQRVDAEFEAYPGFTADRAAGEIASRSAGDEFFAVELATIGKVIGNVYLGRREFNTRELGYVLHEDFQGRGHGTAACRAMIDLAFRRGIHRIYARCSPRNEASWRLMERLGMTREGFFRGDVSFRSDAAGHPIYQDTYLYAVLNPDPTRERPDPRLSVDD